MPSEIVMNKKKHVKENNQDYSNLPIKKNSTHPAPSINSPTKLKKKSKLTPSIPQKSQIQFTAKPPTVI